jgi:hypothetical protein
VINEAFTHAFGCDVYRIGQLCRQMISFSAPLRTMVGGAFRPSAQSPIYAVILIDAKPADFITTCLRPFMSTVCVRASSK